MKIKNSRLKMQSFVLILTLVLCGPMFIYTIGKTVPSDFIENLSVGLIYIVSAASYIILFAIVFILIYGIKKLLCGEVDIDNTIT